MSGAQGTERSAGRMRRLFERFSAAPEEAHPAQSRQETGAAGFTPIGECRDREFVSVAGTLRTVTLRPRAGVPALEAELSDGSAVLGLVWLGRRGIAGIEPGRRITASGRVALNRGRPVLFNPRYELRPVGTE